MAWLNQLPPLAIYGIILVLTAVIYQTTFARPLPVLKQMVVYLFLALGCYLLLIFHILGFPMIPALFATVVLIVVTKARLNMSKKQAQKTENKTV